MELATEALIGRSGLHSTSDFPLILANVANKTLRAAYDTTPRTFTAWARQAVITDFKPVARNQLGGAPDLLRVPESGEFTYGTIGESREVYALVTYGRIVGITRQTLINDDLDAFTASPPPSAPPAADLESDLVYSIFSTNPNMADGNPLFHASHANLGTAGAISETTLAEAYRLFGNQRGLEGRQISVLPRYIITPPGVRSVEAREERDRHHPECGGRGQRLRQPPGTDRGSPPDPRRRARPVVPCGDPSRIDTIEFAYSRASRASTPRLDRASRSTASRSRPATTSPPRPSTGAASSATRASETPPLKEKLDEELHRQWRNHQHYRGGRHCFRPGRAGRQHLLAWPRERRRSARTAVIRLVGVFSLRRRRRRLGRSARRSTGCREQPDHSVLTGNTRNRHRHAGRGGRRGRYDGGRAPERGARPEMSAFANATAALFRDPNLAQDALWRAGGRTRRWPSASCCGGQMR